MDGRKQKIELLAPVGGLEQLNAAINFGADAVYLAGQNFGMRAMAANFNNDELASAVDIAHKNNVSVYVTCNVLIHEPMLDNLRDYFKFLANIGVDAFIIGDVGAISIAKQVAPNVAIHVSTQASVANSAAAVEYAKMGAKRIVLAREMSLSQISNLRKSLDIQGYKDIELEAFVHGAMCMSISGRCLISSYLTGRSANQGACTQPCRWGYSLIEEKRPGQKFDIGEDDFGTFIMNSKDLNMLSHLNDIQNAGINSIKIEGRNKKSLYVATVVNAYRHVLDGESSKQWQTELENISHRPYSTGFYFGEAEQSPDYDGYEQNCVHVADVLECEKIDNNNKNEVLYKVKVLCRNHFEQNEQLDVLVPGGQIEKICPLNLKLHPTQESTGKAVEIANRAKEIYSFECETSLLPGSLIRSKTYLRTSREKSE